jgi:hypothetical protein
VAGKYIPKFNVGWHSGYYSRAIGVRWRREIRKAASPPEHHCPVEKKNHRRHELARGCIVSNQETALIPEPAGAPIQIQYAQEPYLYVT